MKQGPCQTQAQNQTGTEDSINPWLVNFTLGLYKFEWASKVFYYPNHRFWDLRVVRLVTKKVSFLA